MSMVVRNNSIKVLALYYYVYSLVAIVCLCVPANCLSPMPLLPNLVTSFPLGWKMNTMQALLSTTIT